MTSPSDPRRLDEVLPDVVEDLISRHLRHRGELVIDRLRVEPQTVAIRYADEVCEPPADLASYFEFPLICHVVANA